MYGYRVGYGSYEDSGFIVLMHKEEFTEAEFDNMVINSTINIVEEDKAKGEFHHGFDGLYEQVANRMIKDYGFVKLEYKATFAVFGWASIFSNEDWESQRDGQLKKLTDALVAKGFCFGDDDRQKREEE